MSELRRPEIRRYQFQQFKERSKSPIIIKSYKGREPTFNNNTQKSQLERTLNPINQKNNPLKVYDSAASAILRNKIQLTNKEKQDSNKNQKLFTKTIFYQNNLLQQFDDNFRVETFYKDGSSISWKKQSVVYLSSKAIKTRVNLKDIYRSDDLSFKFIQIVQKMNRFNDPFYVLQKKMKAKITETLKNSAIYKNNQTQKSNKVYKKYKIEEYFWQKCRIDECKEGYLIQSNDQNAEMILCNDLFRVKICYLQFTNVRKIENRQQLQQSDEEDSDNTLEKYTFHPPIKIQNNKKSQQAQVWYEFIKITKQFSIFNLPERWYYPIDQIWTYILANKIIKHEFIYIDFFQQNISLKKSTKMPFVLTIGQKMMENEYDNESLIRDNASLPLYTKPTHEDKCRWICFHDDKQKSLTTKAQKIMWLNSESQQNIFFDSYGFWKSSLDGISVLYKRKNCFDTIIKYNFNVVPLIIRINQQPQRCLQSALMAFNFYIEHNKRIEHNEVTKQQAQMLTVPMGNIGKDSEEIVFQENIPDVGHFKVYGNNTIVGKFVDRIMLTLRGDIVTVFDDIGEAITLNLNKKKHYSQKTFDSNIRNPYVRFREHIKYVTEFYERFFYYDDWVRKQQLIEGLDHLRVANQAFINVCERMKK